MKTTEELRKELEQLKREECDACLDFSHKIKPLEEQLNAAEKGDLLFGDVQLQSKLAYVNDLLTNSGIPMLVARKSEVLEFTSKEQTNNTYKQLALFYKRSQNKGLQLLYTFEVAKSIGELLDQLNLVEQQLDLLKFICSLTRNKDIPPYFRGELGEGEISLYYFELDGYFLDGSNLFIAYDSAVDCYKLRLERVVKCLCKDTSALTSNVRVGSNANVRFDGLERLTLTVSKEDVRSSDLQSALDELKARLLELNKKGKVTVQVSLVTE